MKGFSKMSVALTLFLSLTTHAGRIKGTVSDGDLGVASLHVRLDSDKATVTDTDGLFLFEDVKEGKHTINVEGFGYFNESRSIVMISPEEEIEVTVTVFERPCYTVSGHVEIIESDSELTGMPVVAEGEVTAISQTDARGDFSFDLYGGYDWVVRPIGHLLDCTQKTIALNSDTEVEFEVRPCEVSVSNLKLERGSDSLSLSWDIPLTEFRHDTGEFIDATGFKPGEGQEKIVLGSSWRHSAELIKASWWVSGASSKHDSVWLYVFPLDRTGQPLTTPLFAQEVPSSDDVWSSYIFTEQLRCPEGFLIGVGSDSFVGIGLTRSNDAYPYVKGSQWYCGFPYDDPDAVFSDLSSMGKVQLMIRADGVDNGYVVDVDGKNEVLAYGDLKYEVERWTGSQSEWTQAGIVGDGFFEETTDLPYDQYAWKIIPCNFGREGVPSETERVGLEFAETEALPSDDCTSWLVYDLSGRRVMIVSDIEHAKDALPSGIYILTSTEGGEHIKTKKLIITQ